MEKLITILQVILSAGKNLWSKYTLNTRGHIVLSVLIGLVIGIPVNLWLAKFSVGRGFLYVGIIGAILHNIVLTGVMKGWWNLGWWGQIQKAVYTEVVTPFYAWATIMTTVVFTGVFLISGYHFIYSLMLLVVISSIALFREAKVIK